MSEKFAEILILIPTVLETGLLLFIAGVVQKVMNDMDEATFKSFLATLFKRAEKDVYAVFVASITFVAMIPYFIFYGFHNGWYIAGLVVWVVASVVSKLFNLPIYTKVAALASSDAAQLNEERHKLQRANQLRAWLSLASVVLMVIGLL